MNTEQIAKNYILTKNTDQEFVPQLLLSFKLDNSDSIFDTSTFVTLLFPKYIEEKQFVQEDLLELITENLYYYNEYDDETLLVFENIEVHMLKISAKTWIKNQKYLKLCILINIILDTPVVNRIKNKIISQKLQFALEHEIPIPEVLYALVVVNNKIQYAYHDNLLIALYNYQKFNYNQDCQPKQIDQLMIQSILLLQRHYDQLEEIIQIIVQDQESIFNQNLKSIDISDTISFLLLTAIEMLGESQKIKIISKNVNHNDCTLAKEEIDHNIEIKCKILLAVAVEKLVLFIELLSRIKIDKNEILLYKCPNLIVSLHKIPQLKTTISTLKQNFSLIDSEFDKYKYISLSVIVEKMFLLILDNCTKYREKIEYHLQKPQFKCFHQNILLSDNPNFQGIKDVIRDLMGFIIITSKTLKSNYYVSQQEQIRQAVLQILQFYCENQIVFLEIFRFITSELKLNNFENLIQCLDVHPGMWEFSKTSSFSTNNCTQQQLLTAQKYCLVNFVYINTIMEISKQSESGIIVRMVSLIYTKRYQYHDDLKLILQEDGIKENLFKIEEKYSLSFHEIIRKLMSFY